MILSKNNKNDMRIYLGGQQELGWVKCVFALSYKNNIENESISED